jgi:hypothetical protein
MKPLNEICITLADAAKNGNEHAGECLKVIAAALRVGDKQVVNWDYIDKLVTELQENKRWATT